MRVLGLDPGLRHTGWGVIDVAGNHLAHVADGVVHAATNQPLAMRLVSLFRQITAVLDIGPTSVAGDRRLDPLSAAVYLLQTILQEDGLARLELGEIDDHVGALRHSQLHAGDLHWLRQQVAVVGYLEERKSCAQVVVIGKE